MLNASSLGNPNNKKPPEILPTKSGEGGYQGLRSVFPKRIFVPAGEMGWMKVEGGPNFPTLGWNRRKLVAAS